MNKKIIIIIGVFAITLFSLATNASISQQQWKNAHEKNDPEAQYTLACAYDPQETSERSYLCNEIDRNRWCEDTAFYSEAVNPSQCIEKDAEKYIYWLQKSANNGYSSAQIELGQKYIEGNLVNKDIKKGIELLKKADADNNRLASFTLGMFYQYNTDIKPDYQKAVTYYEKVATKSMQELMGLAQYQLSLIYENNIPNTEKAFFWKQHAAENISRDVEIVPSLKYQIAMHYLNGGKPNGERGKAGDEPNYTYLFKLANSNLNQVSAAEAAAIYNLLGWMYLKGYGIEQDLEKAANFYIDSQFRYDYLDDDYNKAIASYSEAQKEMLTFISSIKTNSINQETTIQTLDKIFVDNPEAKKRFVTQLLKRTKNFTYKTTIDGYVYNKSDGERQKCLIALSNLAQQLEIADAIYITGSYYKDLNNKAAQYKRVLKIDPNHIDSIYALATIYDFDVNMPEKALPLYRQAAEQLHRLASYRLGVLNYLGLGTEQNYHEAWKWLNQAASLGDKSAQQFLIKINADHPEAQWLKEQYINHTQVYMSPTVLVDGQDWLESQVDQSAERYYLSTLHQAKEKDFTHKNATRKLCKAALALAKNGHQEFQQRFVSQLLGQDQTYQCEAPISLMLDWINNSENTPQTKSYLQARLYLAYSEDKILKKQANNILFQLIKEKYPEALVYSAENIFRNHSNNKNQVDKALMYANQAIEQGDFSIMKSLMIFYDDDASGQQKVNWERKVHELNLLYNDYTKTYVTGPWYNTTTLPFFDFYPRLDSQTIYSVWSNIAQRYQKGDGIPQDVIMSYVWYSLLVELGQSEFLSKQAEVMQQLTPEQMTLAQERLRTHRQAYRYYPIQI